MDLLLNTLTEWLKELLAGAIASNLTGMVDSVNTKVGDIAAQVGQTPQGWNSGIFHMIQNLSNNVILPIAGIILALVMTMEFIRIIMDKNNMHDFDTWSILMWVFKTACAILIVSNTWNIVMAVFDVSQTVVNNAAGIIVGNTDIELVTEGNADGHGAFQPDRPVVPVHDCRCNHAYPVYHHYAYLLRQND